MREKGMILHPCLHHHVTQPESDPLAAASSSSFLKTKPQPQHIVVTSQLRAASNGFSNALFARIIPTNEFLSARAQLKTRKTYIVGGSKTEALVLCRGRDVKSAQFFSTFIAQTGEKLPSQHHRPINLFRQSRFFRK
jgi:hypothetical protein